MKLALTVLTFLAIIGGVASAQSSVQAGGAPKTIATSFPVKIYAVQASGGEFYSTREKPPSGTVITIFGAFVVMNSTPGYLLDPDSINLAGNDELINQIPTSKVFEFLAQETVVQGTLRGLNAAPTDCSAAARVRVYSASCVSRLGFGQGTKFPRCGGDQNSAWEYAVCRPDGNSIPYVSRVPYSNMVICSGGGQCEPTCPAMDGVVFQ